MIGLQLQHPGADQPQQIYKRPVTIGRYGIIGHQDVNRVLEEERVGRRHPRLLGAGHRMATNEVDPVPAVRPRRRDNAPLGTADIGDKCPGFGEPANFGDQLQDSLDRGANKDQIGPDQRLVELVVAPALVDDAQFQRLRHSLRAADADSAPGETRALERQAQRTADQAHADDDRAPEED